MTYRVEFHASALGQLEGLPATAFDALVDRVSKLVDVPWDALILDPAEPEYRQSIFGELGLLSFYVDDTKRLLRIFDVTWVG